MPAQFGLSQRSGDMWRYVFGHCHVMDMVNW